MLNRSGAEKEQNTGSNTYFIFHSLPASHHCTCAHALPQLRVASDPPLGRFRSGGRLAAIPCSIFRRTFLRLKRCLPVATHSRSIRSGTHKHPTHLLPKTKPLADINLVCNPHTHTLTRVGQGWEYSAVMFILMNSLSLVFIAVSYVKMLQAIRGSGEAMRSTLSGRENAVARR